MRPAAALTLIELLVVMSIMAALAGISVPVIQSVRNDQLAAQGIDRMRQVHLSAMQLARRYHSSDQVELAFLGAVDPDLSHQYAIGMAVAQGRATVVFGRDGNAAELLVDGRPYHRETIPADLVLWSATSGAPAPVTGRVVWFYALGSGQVIAAPDAPTVVDVGVPAQAAQAAVTIAAADSASGALEYIMPALPALPASPVASHLSLRRTNQVALAVAIYGVGSFAHGEFKP